MALETKRLGQSDLWITKVGIGSAPIGSTLDWRIYWGPQDENDAIRAIHRAIDAGVNWIDTAPFYGWGRAEQIIGKALRGRRDKVYIFTKCGTLPDGSGGWMERAMTIAPIASNQHQYNLLMPDVERDILPFSQKNRIGMLAWSPLASGFLVDDFDLESLDANDFRRRHRLARPETYAKLAGLRASLKDVASSRGRRMRELAVAWVLTHPAITGAIIGIRNDKEASEMLSGTDWQLTDEEMKRIQSALALWNTAT